MSSAVHKSTLPPESFTTFGELLKYLRRRARLTQQNLATAVGYSVAQVCRFEQNRWRPNQATIGALFIPALDLQNAPEYAARLLQLAAEPKARPRTITVTHTVEEEIVETVEDLGALEDVPAPPAHNVARPDQLAQLQAQLALHRCLALVGMAGVGKTSLAAALAREYTSPAFWLTMTTGVTASADAVARQLALFLFAYGQTRLEPLLRERRDAPLSPAQKISLIGAGLQAMPALLCFDDAHLVVHDESVMQLLRHLTAATPACVLFISREEVPLPNVVALRLDGLQHDEACTLIARLAPALEPLLADRLARRTGGSPMLIRLAVGQLRGNAGKFIAHLEQQPQVGTYLLDTVLRNLPVHAARLAALLAVFRQPIDLFDETLVEAIRAVEGGFDQRRAVAELQRRHLIDQLHEAALHPLIHDHLYEMLVSDLPQRRRLHRVAGEWSDAQGEIVEAAYHYFHAGRLKQAVDVIADQGNWLFNRGQAFTAAALIEEILAYVRQRDPRPDVLRRLLMTHGQLLAFTVRAKEGEASLEQAAALARQADPKVRAEIALALGRTWMRRGQIKEALELFETSAKALSPEDVWLRARLRAFSIDPLTRLTRLTEAERAGDEALALTAQLASLTPRVTDELRSLIYYQLGLAKYRNQKRGEAIACWERSLELARQTGLISTANAVLGNLGGVAFDQGDTDTALRQWQAATDGTLAIGDSHSASVFLANIAIIYRLRAEPEATLTKLDESKSLVRQMGESSWRINAENLRATVLLDLGQAEEARRLVENLIEQSASYSDARLVVNLLEKLIMTQLVCGHIKPAQATLQQMLESPLLQNDAEYRSRINTTTAVVRLVEGDFDVAAVLLADQSSHHPTRVTAERNLAGAVLALARGEVAQAHELAQSVADQARRSGALVIARRADRLLTLSVAPPLAEMPRLMWM